MLRDCLQLYPVNDRNGVFSCRACLKCSVPLACLAVRILPDDVDKASRL